jgi:hypothetical protein
VITDARTVCSAVESLGMEAHRSARPRAQCVLRSAVFSVCLRCIRLCTLLR